MLHGHIGDTGSYPRFIRWPEHAHGLWWVPLYCLPVRSVGTCASARVVLSTYTTGSWIVPDCHQTTNSHYTRAIHAGAGGDGDDVASLLTSSWRVMRRTVLKRNGVPEFAFRQYLFAAQVGEWLPADWLLTPPVPPCAVCRACSCCGSPTRTVPSSPCAGLKPNRLRSVLAASLLSCS